MPGTGRTSPASPSSPTAIIPCGTGAESFAEATATATARSEAGSESRTPPTVAT